VDILARAMAEAMSATLGQPIVVENRPGANGTIGAAAGAAAAPDGYTIMMNGPGEIAIAPHLMKQMAYDPVRDLAPITLCSRSSTFRTRAQLHRSPTSSVARLRWDT
jgi:tripartite-type tricarboxylate transporter receptor subunit TctC